MDVGKSELGERMSQNRHEQLTDIMLGWQDRLRVAQLAGDADLERECSIGLQAAKDDIERYLDCYHPRQLYVEAEKTDQAPCDDMLATPIEEALWQGKRLIIGEEFFDNDVVMALLETDQHAVIGCKYEGKIVLLSNPYDLGDHKEKELYSRNAIGAKSAHGANAFSFEKDKVKRL